MSRATKESVRRTARRNGRLGGRPARWPPGSIRRNILMTPQLQQRVEEFARARSISWSDAIHWLAGLKPPSAPLPA